MMEGCQRVIFFGDSLILSGVRLSLENCAGLEVILLDQPLDRTLEELRRLSPATVIFDLGVVKPDSLLSLLLQPDLLLIGIDPETHQALVWSGRQAEVVAASDLISVIRNHSQADERRKK